MSETQTEQNNNTELRDQTIQLEGDFINWNVWADREIIEVIKNISDDLYYEDVGNTIGTLHKKVAHIVSIMKFFRLVFQNQTPSKFPDLSNLTREELIELWERLNEFFIEKIEEVPNGKGVFTLLFNIKAEFDIRNIYFDVYTHSAYHRGQVNTILRLLELKTQNVDYFPWFFTDKNPRNQVKSGDSY
jgi:uncharacterized damage-inducible protein DinB